MEFLEVRVRDLLQEIKKIANNQEFIDELRVEIERYEETNDPFFLLEKAKEVIRVLESELSENWSEKFKEFFHDFAAIEPGAVTDRYLVGLEEGNTDTVAACHRYFAWERVSDPYLKTLVNGALHHEDWKGADLFLKQWMERHPTEEGILDLFSEEFHPKGAASLCYRLSQDPASFVLPELRAVAEQYFPEIESINTVLWCDAQEGKERLSDIVSQGFPFLDLFFHAATDEGIDEILWEYPIAHLTVEPEVRSQEALEELADSLRVEVNLQSFDLRAETFSFDAALHFGRALARNITLESLRLQTTETFDVALGAIFWSLSANRGLRNLDVSGTEAGIEVWATLFHSLCLNQGIQSVNVSETELRNLGPQIGQFIRTSGTLKRLSMRATELRSDDLIWIGEAVGESVTLESLDLSDNDIGAEGIEALAAGIRQNQSLKSLKIGRNPLSDAALVPLVEALRDHPTITSVNFCHLLAGPHTATALAEMLRVNRVIQNINLQGNRLEDSDIELLAKVLPKAKGLQSISLKGNLIGFDGAEVLADVLQAGCSLKRLNLKNNPIPATCRSRIIDLADQMELFIDEIAA